MEFPKTRRKIEEAESCLGEMEKHAHTALQRGAGQDWELKVFRFYLSAFLSAGMSVRDNVLRKENKKVYDAVHPAWESRLTPEDRLVWESMKDRRDDEVHIAGLELEHGSALVLIVEARTRSGWAPMESRIVPVMAALSEGGEVQIGVLAPKFVNSDGSRTDVLSECRKYLDLLKGLLLACQQFTL